MQDVDECQRWAYREFEGAKIGELARFLDKEKRREREAEERNIPFTKRSDDEMDLY
jgi:F-box and leucine-rich repeat protein GRR1